MKEFLTAVGLLLLAVTKDKKRTTARSRLGQQAVARQRLQESRMLSLYLNIFILEKERWKFINSLFLLLFLWIRDLFPNILSIPSFLLSIIGYHLLNR
jgi:hypothetical protein